MFFSAQTHADICPQTITTKKQQITTQFAPQNPSKTPIFSPTHHVPKNSKN
jgi:hypothetical protein